MKCNIQSIQIKSQMLHFLQVVLRSFNRSRTKTKMPKIHIINIATSGPLTIVKRSANNIARDIFSAINRANRVIGLLISSFCRTRDTFYRRGPPSGDYCQFSNSLMALAAATTSPSSHQSTAMKVGRLPCCCQHSVAR